MAKELRVIKCRDAGVDCDFEIRAATDDEILDAAEVHAVRRHQMQWGPEVVAYVKSAIRTLEV